MKKSLVLGIIVLLIACKAGKPTAISAENFSTDAEVGSIMNYLASDELNGRDSGTEGIEKAAIFIENRLEGYRINPYYSSYRDTLTGITPTAYNVVGFLPGNDPELKKEFIVLGAHYDHIGIIKPKEGDSIANGANDNASGTTTVLELARYFSKARSNKRSLIFAFFSAEEKGLQGSVHLAKRMKQEALNLYTMLNFEMTGVAMTDKDYLIYVSGYNKSNLAEVSNRYAQDNLVGFLPTAEGFNLFMRSDNYPFHDQFMVPSQTFSSFDFTNFDHYHQVGDEAAIMDFEHMARVVNKMIPVVEGIANATIKEVKYN